MKTEDIPCRRKKQRVIRLEVEYAPTSEIRAAHAIAILAYLFEESIVKRRKEQRNGSRRCSEPHQGGEFVPRGEQKITKENPGPFLDPGLCVPLFRAGVVDGD